MTVDLTADPSAHADDDRDRTTRARSAGAPSPSPPHPRAPSEPRIRTRRCRPPAATPAISTSTRRSPPSARTDFDVEAYTRRGTRRIAVDTELLASQEPLRDQERLALGVLQRMESSGLAEARTMLSTVTANEARITAFLATWLVDRHWQARAARDLLTGDHPVERPAPSRRPSRLAVFAPPPRGPRPAAADPAVERRGRGARRRRPHGPHGDPGGLARGGPRRDRTAPGRRGRARGPHRARPPGGGGRLLHPGGHRPHHPLAQGGRRRTARAEPGLPAHGGGVPDPDLDAALQVLGADPRDRAGLHRARREITRSLPGPDLPDAHLLSLPRSGA
ncbi:hypothetical protein [Brachybacterium sp. GPGPB12]|uniref:hypothetical protein n=1 Tax=Brachybacterium sp. GPGPB12 TaxID=3023517 RepID=UPI00313453C0